MEIFAAEGMNNFVFSHLFSIPFIKSALLCAAAMDVSPPTSGRGRELGVLASILTTYLPPHRPQSLLAHQSPHTLRISWTFIGDILGVYWPYIRLIYWACHIFYQHTLTTSLPHLHNILTTPPKQYCEVISIHANTPLPPLIVQLILLPHSAIKLVWLYACPECVIFPSILLRNCPSRCDKFYYISPHALPKMIGWVFFFEDSALQEQPNAHWNCKPSSFTTVTSYESCRSSL